MNPFDSKGHLKKEVQERATHILNRFRKARHLSVREIGRAALIMPEIISHAQLDRMFNGYQDWTLCVLLRVLEEVELMAMWDRVVENRKRYEGNLWHYIAYGRPFETWGWAHALTDGKNCQGVYRFFYPGIIRAKRWMRTVRRYDWAASEIRTVCTVPPWWLYPKQMEQHVRAGYTQLYADAGISSVRVISEGLKEWSRIDRSLYRKRRASYPKRSIAMPLGALLDIVHCRGIFRFCERLDVCDFLTRLLEYHIKKRKLRFWIPSLPFNPFNSIESFTSYDGMMVTMMPAGLSAWPYLVERRPGTFLPQRLELVARMLGGIRSAPSVPQIELVASGVADFPDIFADYDEGYVEWCLRKLLEVARGTLPDEFKKESPASPPQTMPESQPAINVPQWAKRKNSQATQNLTAFWRQLQDSPG